MSSISYLLTYQTLVDQSWSPKVLESILVSSSTENFYPINTLTSTPTKQSWLSSVWESSETLLEVSFLSRNIFFIKSVSSPLFSMVINYGFTTEPHYHTHLGSLTKCNKEPLSGSLVCSKPSLCLGLRPLLASTPSIFTSTNLVVKLN